MTTVDRTGCSAALHGTSWAYDRHRCRCADARAYKNRWHKPQVRGTGQHGRDRTEPDQLSIDIALDRARLGGPPPLLNVPERRTVVATLTAAGWTAARIALALGLAQRSVVRHRTATAA